MFLQKVISRKNCVKKFVFCWHLEGQWRTKQDPDPLVRGMNPRIRIWIHPKIHGSATLAPRDEGKILTFFCQDDIKVIAATNRIDILDPALLRSGRLDRKIEFPAPTEEARARIMQIHARYLPLSCSFFLVIRIHRIRILRSSSPPPPRRPGRGSCKSMPGTYRSLVLFFL